MQPRVPPFSLSLRALLAIAFWWLVIYFEPLQLGPLKLSQLWKLALIAMMATIVFRRSIPLWMLFALLFALKQLVYITFPNGVVTALSNATEALIFPFLVCTLFVMYRKKPYSLVTLHDLSINISLFFVLSSVPFLFGLQSLQPERDLTMWGLDRNATTGLFYALASASQTYLIATLILLSSYNRFTHSYKSIAFLIAVVILGTYLVFFSYTRTGWIVYAGGLIILSFSIKKTKHRILAFSILALGAIVAFTYLSQNEAFLLRLAGGATYRRDVDVGLDAILNSRVPFIMIAIENLNSFGIPGWIMGYGDETAKEMFLVKRGLAITSHNATFTLIEGSGLIGLALFLLFVVTLWRRVRCGMKLYPPLRLPVVIGAYCWVSLFLISHGLPFYGQIVLSGIAASMLVAASWSNTKNYSQFSSVRV